MPKAHGTPAFDPMKALVGSPHNPIWVVALNPKVGNDAVEGFNQMRWDDASPDHPHFYRLESVLREWHQHLFLQNGVSHTDLVKCGSDRFDDTAKAAAEHCGQFLKKQIDTYRPRLVLAIGSSTSKFLAAAANLGEEVTEGDWQFAERPELKVHLVFSGYTSPRQDGYAKKRLARDFENACKTLNLSPPNVLPVEDDSGVE